MAGEGSADRPLALVEVAHLSDTGRVRHHNEDRALASPRMLVVADGMGGAKAGEVAAQMAVDAVGRLVGQPSADEVRSASSIQIVPADGTPRAGASGTLSAGAMRRMPRSG